MSTMRAMPRPRPILFLAAALALGGILSGCTMWKKPATSSWSNATGAEQYERLLWQDIKAKDWTSVSQHLSSTFVDLDPSGTRDRDATMEHLKGIDIDDYSIGNMTVTPSGNDMVVTYTISLRGKQGGHPLPATSFRMMTVWQQMKKGWIAAAHSSTPVLSDASVATAR